MSGALRHDLTANALLFLRGVKCHGLGLSPSGLWGFAATNNEITLIYLYFNVALTNTNHICDSKSNLFFRTQSRKQTVQNNTVKKKK